MILQTNRYGVKTPTAITSTGLAISTPFYISPTNDQAKAMLNAFRVVKQKQLLEMGWNPTTEHGYSGISVVDNTAPPKCAIEIELGMDEDNLRYTLFNRNGIQERLFLKIQSLVGLELITRSEVEQVMTEWLEHTFPVNEKKGTTTTSKASKPATKKRSAKSTTSVTTTEAELAS